ncbi:hypothetical protein [Edaphobacter modestus]|uniref:hypothetical protein n=1 Tax=Edaphobacter modestus TaxID=388466 RepID=UPI00102B4A28|nr:hypothetical protein [Edaphobacter modestus]
MQGLGYGFFLVPVNVVAYSQLRPDQNNKASSLTNLFRNWRGSFGIAFITTAAERRGELPSDGPWVSPRKQLSGPSAKHQYDHWLPDATWIYECGCGCPAALGVVYQQLLRQSLFLAFMDCFRVIGWVTVCMFPLAFLIRKFKAGGAPAGGH